MIMLLNLQAYKNMRSTGQAPQYFIHQLAIFRRGTGQHLRIGHLSQGLWYVSLLI